MSRSVPCRAALIVEKEIERDGMYGACAAIFCKNNRWDIQQQFVLRASKKLFLKKLSNAGAGTAR